jgi:uncharacterized membrane protein YphA (DoxX/SURF4 family)
MPYRAGRESGSGRRHRRLARMPLSCLMLSGVMIVALATVILPGVEATYLTSWLRSVLYLPKVLYLVILMWLFFSGAGWFSVDSVISGVVPSGV